MKFFRIIFLALALAIQTKAATGSWNGVAFTALNGVAQTAWNGTGVSCAGGAAFAPTDLPNLTLWLDGSDATQLFTDIALTTAVSADGNDVNGWKDKSGNANHFVTASTAAKATYKTGIKNGKSIVRFNGTASQFQKTLSSLTARSIFIVFIDTANSASGYGTLMMVNSSTHGFQSKHNAGPVYQLSLYTGTETDSTGVSFTAGVFHTFTGIWNGAGAYTVYKDGTSFSTGTADTTLAYDRIGGHGSEWLAGDIAEVIIYSDAKNGTDQTSVQNYLTTKWSLP